MTLQPRRASTPSAKPVLYRGHRVLIIDDDADGLEALSELLETSGYEVSVACGGDEGVGLAATVRPDAVVLDVGLPNCDSPEVIRRLKAHDASIVAFSRAADDEGAARAAGANWFVLKPDSDTLERVLACVMRGAAPAVVGAR
jgi:DNA-binding response OmpR family regulator